MDMFVQAPVMMIVSRPRPARRFSRRVPLPGAHAHLLDDEIAVLRLQAIGRRGTPRAPHQGAGVLDAVEERRVQLQPGSALIDDVPDVDHWDLLATAECGQVLHVLDDVLLLGVLRRPRLGEGAPSMMTSFWRSWTISAQRETSSV